MSKMELNKNFKKEVSQTSVNNHQQQPPWIKFFGWVQG